MSLVSGWSQQPGASYTPPDDLAYRKANITSEGVRLSAELFAPKSAGDKKLPVIVMGHGWGGVAALLRPDATVFARAGYLVVTFDYRGWGASDSRVILTKPAPAEPASKPGVARTYNAEVTEVREVVDPLEMTTDWLNVLHWLQGEPQADVSRIGIWGSSFAGGHVVWVAEHDPRVKVLVSQVGAMDSRPRTEADRKLYLEEATKVARGEKGYPAPRAQVVGQLRGGPIYSSFLQYAPVDDVERASQCAMLFIIAEKEELFDNRDHAIKAHERAKGPKKLVTIPGITHYGVYTTERGRAQKLAVEWFDQWLKK